MTGLNRRLLWQLGGFTATNVDSSGVKLERRREALPVRVCKIAVAQRNNENKCKFIFFSAYLTSEREYKFDSGLNIKIHLKCALNNRHHIRLVLSELRDILFYASRLSFVLKLIIINPNSCFFLLLFQLFFKKKNGKIKEIFWPESAFLKLFIYLFYFLYTTAAMMRHTLKPFPVSFQR